MYLQRLVKISEEEAKLLSRVIAKENFLLTLKDSIFLCNDLIGFPSYRKDKTGKRIGPVIVDLGSYLTPDFELTLEYGFNRYVYQQTRTPGWQQPLSFLCGPVPDGILYGDGVNLYVMAGRGNNIQVRVGAFLDPSKDEEGLIWQRTLAGLAGYFYNRKPVYQSVQAQLLAAKSTFAAKTSEAFIEDLLPLFSGEALPEENYAFKLAFAPVSENLLREEVVKEEKLPWQLLGKIKHFVERSYSYPLEFETKVWLDQAAKTLIFNICRRTEYYSDNSEYTIAKAFVECNTNDFLNQLVASTNFGMLLYEKVKAKILVENI